MGEKLRKRWRPANGFTRLTSQISLVCSPESLHCMKYLVIYLHLKVRWIAPLITFGSTTWRHKLQTYFNILYSVKSLPWSHLSGTPVRMKLSHCWEIGVGLVRSLARWVQATSKEFCLFRSVSDFGCITPIWESRHLASEKIATFAARITRYDCKQNVMWLVFGILKQLIFVHRMVR